jgi:hypothetical protein
MCIYCGTTNYRKIYENHYGSIPKDETGRTYDIHHIDGSRLNNDPGNLTALSIEDHYNVHFIQKDWMACWKIGLKMKIDSDELSKLSRDFQRDRVSKGLHPFIKREDGTSLATDRVEAGTHNFMKREDGSSLSSDRVKTGKHHLLGPKTNKRRLEAGTHNFMKREDGSSMASDMVANGTHPFLKTGKQHRNYDHSIYTLQHSKSGLIESGTKQELGCKLELKDNIYKLINGNRKTVKGWRLI